MNYRQEFFKTVAEHRGDSLLTLGALGLAGETGEVIDLIKKHLFHDKHLSREKIMNELGDVRWYLEAILVATSLTMDEIEAANAAKLRARYPNGYNHEDAAARKDEAISHILSATSEAKMTAEQHVQLGDAIVRLQEEAK